MVGFLETFLLLVFLMMAAAIECPFEPLDDNYYSVGEPAYTVEELEENMEKVFEQNSTSCTPTERVYRSYSSGAVLSSDLTKAAGKHCAIPGQCKHSKLGSLQAATCTELLRIRDEITSGGYTATCRHDLTNWNLGPSEKNGCRADGTCTDPNYSIFLQRRLSPAGLRRSSVQGQSLLKAGVKIDSLVSSSYERAKRSALQVGHWFGISEVKEEPLPLDNGIHGAKDYERKAGYTPKTSSDRSADIKKITRVRLRKWLQEDWVKKTGGGVRYTYSHGGQMRNAFGYSFDEGDCAWSKPTENKYDLKEPLNVVLSNKEFPNEMSVDTKKIDLFAVLSPEQTQKIAQCTELRTDLIKETFSSSDTTILAADKNKDLEITEDEFTKFCINIISLDTSRSCSDLWATVLSLQAKPYWKKNSDTTSFFIGEHAYFNGGWSEKKHSAGGWQFPYRGTTLDTIRPTVSEMKQILAPLDELIRTDLNDKRAIDCTLKESTIQLFSGCTSSMLSYKPVPTNSRPEDDASQTDGHPIPGEKYAYPTTITITPVPNPLTKLAMCMVEKGYISFERMSLLMGCNEETSAVHRT